MMESSPNKWLWKRAVVACSIFATVVMLHSLAYGHARLMRSQPAANATLKQAPKLVELWFSEDLEPTMSTVTVTDQSGKRVDKNNATVAEGNKKLQIDLEDLGSGTYTVDWKALATDQHTMKGKFTFKVAIAENASNASTPAQSLSPTSIQPTPTPLVSPAIAESTEESGSTWMMSFVRWLQYLAMMSLVGGFALRLFVLGPALRTGSATVDEKSDALAMGQRRILFLSWASVVLLLISTFIALVQQASAVFDKTIGDSLSSSALGEVLTKTGYGGAWFLQVGTAFALVIILLLGLGLKRSPAQEHTALWWTALLIGIVLLVAPSWTGHAAAAIKDFRLAVVTDWLHLVAAAFWVGGLFHLALVTRPILRGLDRTKRAGVLHQIVRLFTKVAIPTVVVLVLAGLYNTWVHVDSFGELWSTAYGRFHFGKKAARLSESEESEDAAPEHSKLEKGFSRSVMFEAVLGVAVLLVTAILVFQTPARSHPVMTFSRAGSALVQKGN